MSTGVVPPSLTTVVPPVVVDDQRLAALLEAEPADDAAPYLNQARVFLPLMVVLSFLPGLSALMLPQRSDELAETGLAGMAVLKSRAMGEWLIPIVDGASTPFPSPWTAWLTALVMRLPLFDAWTAVGCVSLVAVAGAVLTATAIQQCLGMPRRALFTALWLACHLDWIDLVHAAPARAWALLGLTLTFWCMLRHSQTRQIISGWLLCAMLATAMAMLSGGFSLWLLSIALCLGSSIFAPTSLAVTPGTMPLKRWHGWWIFAVGALLLGGWWRGLQAGLSTLDSPEVHFLSGRVVDPVRGWLDLGPAFAAWVVIGLFQAVHDLRNRNDLPRQYAALQTLGLLILLVLGRLTVFRHSPEMFRDLVGLPLGMLAAAGLSDALERRVRLETMVLGCVAAIFVIGNSLKTLELDVPRLAQLVLLVGLLVTLVWIMIRQPWTKTVNSPERLIPLRLAAAASLAAHVVYLLSTATTPRVEDVRIEHLRAKLQQIPQVERVIVHAPHGELPLNLRFCVASTQPAARWTRSSDATAARTVVTDAERSETGDRVLIISWTLRDRLYFPETAGRVTRHAVVDAAPLRGRKLSLQWLEPVEKATLAPGI